MFNVIDIQPANPAWELHKELERIYDGSLVYADRVRQLQPNAQNLQIVIPTNMEKARKNGIPSDGCAIVSSNGSVFTGHLLWSHTTVDQELAFGNTKPFRTIKNVRKDEFICLDESDPDIHNRIKRLYENKDAIAAQIFLNKAIALCNVDNVKEAIRLGIDPNFKSVLDGVWNSPILRIIMTPASSMSSYSISNIKEMLQLIIDAGADVNVAGLEGFTPLQLACSRPEHHELVEILLHAGANINAQDHSGDTALMQSANNKCINALAILLNANADLEIQNNKKQTALDIANFSARDRQNPSDEAYLMLRATAQSKELTHSIDHASTKNNYGPVPIIASCPRRNIF